MNHYADTMEIVWYDELDKVLANTQDLKSVALGSLISRASALGSAASSVPALCSVTSDSYNHGRTSPDVTKTSGF